MNLISGLYQWKISFFFRTKVDPEADELVDYFDVVKQPMDLDTVKSTLLDDKYADVGSFLADLRLICDNTELYFGPDTVMTFMAQEMRQYLDKQEQTADMSPEQIWYQELQELESRIEKHIAKMVSPPIPRPPTPTRNSPRKRRH